jgi:uncharacterized membrane protein
VTTIRPSTNAITVARVLAIAINSVGASSGCPRINQVVLSVFVATFTYSTASLFTVGVSAGQRVEDSRSWR